MDSIQNILILLVKRNLLPRGYIKKKKMKKLIYSVVLFCAGFSLNAQTPIAMDTLFMHDGKKIPCKIYEISEFEMRARIEGENGPLIIFDKFKVRKYQLSTGYSEILMPDELSVENEHASIINNREVIKLHPFSPAFNHISLAYEKVIKVGMNLDIQAGYINSDITNRGNSNTSLGLNINSYHSGFYVKPGMKFFIGQDYAVKGMKYAHPLKGSYLKLDLAFSYLDFQNISVIYYNYGNTQPFSPGTPSVISTDIHSSSYGGFVNFGRQMILGNLFTFDIFVGAGFTGQSITYTNPDFIYTLKTSNNYGNVYYSYGEGRINNYYGWLRVPGIGLSFTSGLRLGYIIPSKKDKKKELTALKQ